LTRSALNTNGAALKYPEATITAVRDIITTAHSDTHSPMLP
jgi:hypothetical protein